MPATAGCFITGFFATKLFTAFILFAVFFMAFLQYLSDNGGVGTADLIEASLAL